MKPRLAKAFILGIFCAALMVPAPAQVTAKKLDVAALEGVPDGNYLVTLELKGKPERLNFAIKDGRATCVNASDPALKGVRGVFQKFDQVEGGFLIRYQTPVVGSQLWIFRPDGAAAVREAPDRGEQQSAVPVKGDSITVPKK